MFNHFLMLCKKIKLADINRTQKANQILYNKSCVAKNLISFFQHHERSESKSSKRQLKELTVKILGFKN